VPLSHNPYFTGNSFAMLQLNFDEFPELNHNPYFTGNSFAIN